MNQSILLSLLVASLVSSALTAEVKPGEQLDRKEATKYEPGATQAPVEGQAKEADKATPTETGGPGSLYGTTQTPADKQKYKDPLVDAAYLIIGDYLKLVLNPIELTRTIADKFKLNFEKLTSIVGKNVLYGPEAALAPLVASMRLFEKVFVPDTCLLKLTCSMGARFSFISGSVLRLANSDVLEGSKHVKAFADGLFGKDCEVAYVGCTSNMLTVQKSVRDEASLSIYPRARSGSFEPEEKRKPLLAFTVGQESRQVAQEKA